MLALLGVGVFRELGETLVAFGVGCVVPLGVALSAEARADGAHPWTFRAVAMAVPLCAPLGVASFMLAPGPLAGAMAGAWLLTTLLVALAALARIAHRGIGPIEQCAIDVGHLYLPVGGAWLLASRAGMSPMGFHEPIVLYTANHFHFAGLAAPVVVGLLGRELGLRPAPLDPSARRASAFVASAYRASAAVVMAGIPLVAAGIVISHALEAPAAVLLGTGMLTASCLLMRVGALRISANTASRARWSGALLLVAGLSLVLSMGFAIAFTLTGSAGRGASGGWIPYPTMVAVHGVANALGFAFCALAAFTLCPPPRRMNAFASSLPTLFSRGFVGPDFFDRAGAVDPSRTVRGQLASLDDFAHAHFDPHLIDPAVRDFYENTADYALHVSPAWHFPFATAAVLFQRFARRFLGQLELPTRPEGSETVSTRLFALDDARDGRSDVRGYVRTYGEGAGARANYVAAYSTHTSSSCRHLSCAFPLPFCALLGVLRFEHGERPGSLYVTSGPRELRGDEGMFLATRFGPLRLPVQERIDVWADAGALRALHAVRVLGLRCVTLEYTLTRRA